MKSVIFQKNGINILVFPKKVVPLHPISKNRLRNQASPQQRASSLHLACTDFVTA